MEALSIDRTFRFHPEGRLRKVFMIEFTDHKDRTTQQVFSESMFHLINQKGDD